LRVEAQTSPPRALLAASLCHICSPKPREEKRDWDQENEAGTQNTEHRIQEAKYRLSFEF
jgi:hypothetical protein